MTLQPTLGIVIPALDEEEALPSLLEDLSWLSLDYRIVVADGGSSDQTRCLALEAGCRVVDAPRGRGRQLNAGASVLDTRWILFLHADVRFPVETARALERWLASPPPEEAAVFRFRMDAGGFGWRAIEIGQRVRERLTGLSYGDQGLIISRERFDSVGGFPEFPVMEDVEMVRKLRARGGLARIDAPVLSSARRYREDGPFRGWVRNALLIALYGAGVSAERLAPLYPARVNAAPPRPVGRRVLLVFAKAPVPGKVKTRLAEAIGEEEAAAIYRRLGQEVVDGVREGNYQTVIAFDPPDSAKEVREWLGPNELVFVPQSEGNLGDRLTEAFRNAFADADTVCVIGTDAPGVNRALVERAFAELERPGGAQVVVGPAMDGGYYLLALRRPVDTLFRDIPWSTDRVLERTLERIRRAGLSVALLEPLSDIDRLEDLPEAYRAKL